MNPDISKSDRDYFGRVNEFRRLPLELFFESCHTSIDARRSACRDYFTIWNKLRDKVKQSNSRTTGLALFTGGGTAGHVTPNLAIISVLVTRGWNIQYVGSERGIEREIVEKAGIPYTPISTGKLRRYFSLENFKDPFRVIRGVFQAYGMVRRLEPVVVFSKGGFVALPVVIAASLRRVPVVIHESDLTPGLTTRLSSYFASKICVTFEETARYLKSSEVIVTGTPVRKELLEAQGARALVRCGFEPGKRVLFVFGGSQGSEIINRAVRGILESLLETFQIIHLCGKGKIDPALEGRKGYAQFEYLHAEFADALAAADVALSRAGANSIYELLALRKPNVLIPLSKRASRGDQLLNAAYFERLGFSKVVLEEDLTPDSLHAAILGALSSSRETIAAMERKGLPDTASTIADLLEGYLPHSSPQ